MKAYILSEDREHGIKLANIINAAKHTAVLSEYPPASYEAMIGEAQERVNSGYAFAVVVTRAPLEASIHANKSSKLRAVVCRNAADAARARAARANLVVMDANEFSKTGASSIMHGWLGSTPEIIDEERDATSAGRGIGVGGIGKGIFSAFVGEEEARIKAERPATEKAAKPKARSQPQRDEEEGGDEPKPRGGGIMRKLRYTFGLE